MVGEIAAYRRLLSEQEEAERLRADPEYKDLAEEEIARVRAALPAAEHALRLALLPRDAADERSAILEIRAGTGGEEAALFAADLARMYQRLAEARGWRWEVVEEAPTELGGYREFIAHVSARASSRSSSSSPASTVCSGCRRRNPAGASTLRRRRWRCCRRPRRSTSTSRRRTSASTPCARRAPAASTSTRPNSAVRITHLPTGIVVTSSEKSQHQNRARAMQVLRARLFDLERQRRAAERAADRKGQVGSGDRSERIRTYNFPQGRLTDHRIGLTLYRLDQVMQGDLDEVIEALADRRPGGAAGRAGAVNGPRCPRRRHGAASPPSACRARRATSACSSRRRSGFRSAPDRDGGRRGAGRRRRQRVRSIAWSRSGCDSARWRRSRAAGVLGPRLPR